MRRETLVEILCKLTISYDEFDTINSQIVYDFDRKKYEVEHKKIDGKMIHFQVTYMGAIENENN